MYNPANQYLYDLVDYFSEDLEGFVTSVAYNRRWKEHTYQIDRPGVNQFLLSVPVHLTSEELEVVYEHMLAMWNDN